MRGQLLWDEFVESVLELFAADRQISFLAMTQRRHSRRLLHDQQMLIDIDQPHVGRRGGRGNGVLQNLDNIAGGNLSFHVEAQVAVDLDSSALHELPHLRPRLIRAQSLERGGEREAVVLSGEMKGLRRHSIATTNLTNRTDTKESLPRIFADDTDQMKRKGSHEKHERSKKGGTISLVFVCSCAFCGYFLACDFAFASTKAGIAVARRGAAVALA